MSREKEEEMSLFFCKRTIEFKFKNNQKKTLISLLKERSMPSLPKAAP